MGIQDNINHLDQQIEDLKQLLVENHYMNPEQEDELESLVAQSIKFGELCAKRDAESQAIPEGYVLVKKRKPLIGNPNVDFSTAPKWANYWLKDGHSNKYWWCSNRPKLEESYFLFQGRYQAEEAPSFGFNGDWKNSMTSKKAMIESQESK